MVIDKACFDQAFANNDVNDKSKLVMYESALSMYNEQFKHAP